MTSFGNAVIAMALWATTAGDAFNTVEPLTPKLAANRTEKCGVGPVTIRYEAELQSHILTVANATSPTESQLVCLDESVGWGFFVELPTNVQPRFDAIREARASALARGEARKWLSARGLLERVPKYVPGTTDESAFVVEVENLCGPPARSAFQSKYGFHALSPDWMMKMELPPKPEELEVLACLMNVTTVADFEIHLIGNEAYGIAR